MAESYREWPGYKKGQDLFDMFSATEFGQKLSGESRFWPYVDGHVTHEQWRELVGRDVNNLEHMAYTADLTASMIRETLHDDPTALSQEDSENLLIAAFIHDQGESIMSDTLAPLKTAAIVNDEQTAFHENLARFAPEASAEQRQYLEDIIDTIIFDDTTRLGEFFNAVENVGYLQAGLKMYARVTYNPDSVPEGARDGMLSAAASVVAGSMNRTREHYENMPAVRHFVDGRLGLINEIAENVPPEKLERIHPAGSERLHKHQTMLAEAAVHWRNVELARGTRHTKFIRNELMESA